MLSLLSFRNKTTLFFGSMVLFILFSGCSDNKIKELALLNASCKSLESSTQIIVHQNIILREDIKDKQFDYKFKEKALYWDPKATLIETYSDSMFNYIEALKIALRKEATVKTTYGTDTIELGNMDAITHIFKTSDKVATLLDTLKSYYRNMLSIDSQITYESDSKALVKGQEVMDIQQQDFQQLYFTKTSAIAGLLLLNKLQNDVVSLENKLLTYVKYEFGCLDCGGYRATKAIITQDISYAKPGQQIEITAGIGQFISQAQPIIKVNGKNVNIEDGIGVYKFKASSVPGKHEVPVLIEYYNPDGTKSFAEKSIEYTVGN